MIGGEGRFHYMALALLAMGFSSGSFIGGLLGFLELEPHYLCRNLNEVNSQWYKCAPKENKESLPSFCGRNDIEFKVDLENPHSLEHWYQQIGLTCASKSQIGMIGSSMFIGWAISGLVLPRLADIYGRKIILTFSLGLQLISFAGLFLSTSIGLTTFLMFFFGAAAVGRCSISFLYLMELIPS